MKRKGNSFRKLTDAALSILVLLGTMGLAWVGLRGTKTVPTMAPPAETDDPTAFIPAEAAAIVVDAGHGGFDGGAVGSGTGVVEAELNLTVAKLLADELTKRGFYVVMTRSGPDAIGESKNEDMKRRREIMNYENIDLVVSIHMNKFRDTSISGPMVFYMKGSEEGRSLAERVIAGVCEAVGRPLRCANPEDLFVLRVPSAPSVLVECGFLSNREDEAKLMDPEYQKALAHGIAEGIADYLAAKENGDND